MCWSVKALAEALSTKFTMVEIRNDVTGQPGGEAGREQSDGGAEEKRRSSTPIYTTFTSKSRPLFLKFFSRWLSSFSLSAMLAVLVALNTVKLVDLAGELPFLVPFSQPFVSGLFFAAVRGAHWECRWWRAAPLWRRGRVGKPPVLSLVVLSTSICRARHITTFKLIIDVCFYWQLTTILCIYIIYCSLCCCSVVVYYNVMCL